ncbi:uncharacterized protein LOC119180680 [Rhipicephalus microplus]|uniref:uncharacterized protein LOC119180680 n=1 Tax=Rhipicephalus microplus TaxID=6941 RepID=UPI003F6B0F20
MYFCSLCAYSTCGKAHLAIHAYHEHRDVQPVPWHSKDSILSQPSQSETKYLVRPKEYICGLCKQQCHFRCLTTVMFREHLEEHHCGSVAYDCHLCLTRASSPGVLLEHYRCDHAYFNVHCLYCDFGKEDDWVVMRHIMEKHPDKPFRLLLRNGDSAAVIQELRKLVEEYLSRDPVPQPFLSGSSQVEPCTRSMQQTPDTSRKSNNKLTSSDQLCTIELVPFKTTENILLNNSENEQRTGEVALKSIHVEPRHPAVPVPQSLTCTSFQLEACSYEAAEPRSEAIGDATSQEKNAEYGNTGCKISKNLDSIQSNVGKAESTESELSSLFGHTQCKTAPESEEVISTLQCNVEMEVGRAESAECEREPENDQRTPTIKSTVEMDTPYSHVQNKATPYNDSLTATFKDTSFPGRQQFYCNIQNCTTEFNDVFDFMNHLTDSHPPQSFLHCPKCGIVISPVDLLGHIVERHSGVIFCPYDDCSFGSQNQWDVDEHIIQAHQIYQAERAKADEAVAATEAALCSSAISPSASYDEEGSKDGVDIANVLCYENDEADKQCEEGQTETAQDLTARYLCGTCLTQWDTTLSYLHHMTTVHSVAFFCGHCLKSYKKSRSLLVHAGYYHLGQPFSVWKFEDGKIVEVGKLVAPSWVHEAQCYLKLTCRARLQANGKTMIKNLKTAIDYVTSAVLSNEVEQQQRNTTSSITDDLSTSTTPETRIRCTEPMVDNLHTRVTGSHSFQGKALREPPSALDSLGDNDIDRSLEDSIHSGVLSCVPNDFDVMSSIAQLLKCLPTKTPFRTKPQRSVNGKVHMNILSSVYIDASSCKKVNGKIVVEEEVLQNLASLNTTHVHKKNVGKGPDSFLLGAHARSHVCSVCLISFGTFEDLCKHFAEMHENSFRNIDSASTLVSLQGDWKLQGFTSISNTIRNVKFSSSGDAQIERSNRKIALHFKQMKSRYFKASAITDNIFIRVDGARVPYSQFASVTNLNPVVQLVKLPVMKQEPP